MKPLPLAVAILCASVLGTRSAPAWILPEHTRITTEALRRADVEATDPQRALLAAARQLLSLPCTDADVEACVTVATLPSLAGDHSCSPDQLGSFLATAKEREWIASIVRLGADAQHALDRGSQRPSTREQIRRALNVDLQLADRDYLARALSVDAHFLLPRPPGPLTLDAYLEAALAQGAASNATATYASYHLAALRLADRARSSPGETVPRFVEALRVELYALHFLEDSFASGHLVGHRGPGSVQLGTHDAYSRDGVEAILWVALEAAPGSPRNRESPYVAHGDAFQAARDLDRAARAASRSLAQLLAISTDPATDLLTGTERAVASEHADSCAVGTVRAGLSGLATSRALRDVLLEVPVPSPEAPPLPRVRAEKGVFVGVAVAFDGGHASALPLTTRLGTDDGFVRMRGGARLGIGAAGITDDAMNAQAFVEVGAVATELDALTPDHRSMIGWAFRLRAPGLLPFDGVFLIPLAAATNSPSLIEWAARGADGGPFGYARSRPIARGITWQISALRDAALHVFRNEPRSGDHRTEVLWPMLTARKEISMTGDAPGQAADLWLDLGGTTTWSSQHPAATFGAYASLSMACRIFPSGWLD